METATLKEMPATAEDGYYLVKDLIFDQVHKFRRMYGGDLDELVAEANVAFAKGHNMYAPEHQRQRGAYPTHIRMWVWAELFDAMRVRLKRKKRVKFTSTDAEDCVEPVSSNFNRAAFVCGLSEDAATVTNIVLCPPAAVLQEANDKGGTPRNYKSTVRTYLKAVMGWKTERVNAAFEEIAGAL